MQVEAEYDSYGAYLVSYEATFLGEEKMPIFEVAVIEKATLVGEQNGQTDKLVLAPTTFVAKDGNSAILQAGALLAKGTVPYEPQRAEVQIRPFLK